jgi:steroid 5-alpha reductase family enzyme
MADKNPQRTSAIGIVAALAIGVAVAFAGSQGSTQVGAISVFALAGVIAYAINIVAFVPAILRQTERFFDATGSATYLTVIVAALLLSDDVDARALIVGGLVVVWALRLGTFLFARIRRDGRDGRFDAIKTDAPRFLMTWVLQGLWVFLTLACALAVITSETRESLDVFAVVGIIVWLIGFSIEVMADRQKSIFRADPANRDRFITTGLWAWSRHPNYFGEITLWAGILITALPILDGWRWVVLVSPLFVYLLLTRISGIPMLERRALKKWGDDGEYQRYVANTPALMLRPPR